MWLPWLKRPGKFSLLEKEGREILDNSDGRYV